MSTTRDDVCHEEDRCRPRRDRHGDRLVGSRSLWAVTIFVSVMTIELARFRVFEGAEPQLLAERPAMVDALRRRFPGCLAAYLTKEDDGGWLDVVLWRSRAEAEEAAKAVNSVPECAAWFRHIAESDGLRHADVVAAWPDQLAAGQDRTREGSTP